MLYRPLKKALSSLILKEVPFLEVLITMVYNKDRKKLILIIYNKKEVKVFKIRFRYLILG